MADAGSSFENQDLGGATDHFNGTVDTTSDPIPASAGAPIQSFYVENVNSAKIDLLLSLDGDVTFKTIKKGAFFSGTLKGEPTQIHIKAASATVDFEIVLNREPA